MLIASFFAATMMFSLASFYEVIELWDELYFGGKRIWGPYDAATDLQWDLTGIVVGSFLANRVLRRQKSEVGTPQRKLAIANSQSSIA